MPLQREDVYKGFRFTPYTTRKVLTWAVLVPGVVGYIVYSNLVRTILHGNHNLLLIFLRLQNKWDWRGKLQGESLRKIKQSSPSADAE